MGSGGPQISPLSSGWLGEACGTSLRLSTMDRATEGSEVSGLEEQVQALSKLAALSLGAVVIQK